MSISSIEYADTCSPPPPSETSETLLQRLLDEGVVWGDAFQWLPALPARSVDLFFTSPPYADARSYLSVSPDDYIDWFLPIGRAMLDATSEGGSLALNIKNRVARTGPFRGQRHPYVYQLVLALQEIGWRWIETYIWHKPNAIPGRFGPRTKDSFEYVHHFAKGERPYFDLDAVRTPYRADGGEIRRRRRDRNGRRETAAGFGRDRSRVYNKGGADPGNVISVSQTYNQYRGPAGRHPAVMPEELAEFFVRAASPPGGVVLDPFAGSGTTVVVARALGRHGGGIDLHAEYARLSRERLGAV